MQARSPSPLLKDSTGVLIFFPSVPLKKPRTEWGCHPVAFGSSCKVTPPGRFSRSTILAVLLPRRAVTAFLARETFRAGLPLDGAMGARGLATRAFVAVAGTFSFCSCGIEVVILSISPLAAVAASRHSSLRAPTHASRCYATDRALSLDE